MSLYKEKPLSSVVSIVILAIAFLVMAAPFQLGNRELSSREGLVAAIARDTHTTGILSVSTAQGEVIKEVFPLYPELVRLLNPLNLSPEYQVRIWSFIAIFVLALSVFVIGKRALDREAGFVAAAIVITSMVVLEKSSGSYAEFVGYMFIFFAWTAWFAYGGVDHKWNRAWLFSSIFVGLAFYTIGWYSILLFYLPFIFQRRPLIVWTKLRYPGFIGGIAILVLFIMIWAIPLIMVGHTMTIKASGVELLSRSEYVTHLLSFPFEVAIKFLPWSFLAWAPFCAALARVDKTPLFSRYFGRIVVVLYFFFWLSPFYDSRHLLILVPLVALLTGVNYWVLTRRYSRYFFYGFRCLTALTAVASLLVIAFYLMPNEWIDLSPFFRRGLEFKKDSFTIALIKSVTALILSLYFFFFEKRRIVLWRHSLAVMVAFALLSWGFVDAYKAQVRFKREFAEVVRSSVLQDVTDPFEKIIIYKDKNIAGLYAECVYLGFEAKRIVELDAVTDLPHTVYLLSTRAPFVKGREWKNLLPKGMKYRKAPVYLWKGVKIEKQGEGNAAN